MTEKDTLEGMLQSIETIEKVDHTTIYKVTIRQNSDSCYVLPYIGRINPNDITKMTGKPIKYIVYETGFWIGKTVHQELIGSGVHYHSAKYKSERKKLLEFYKSNSDSL